MISKEVFLLVCRFFLEFALRILGLVFKKRAKVHSKGEERTEIEIRIGKFYLKISIKKRDIT